MCVYMTCQRSVCPSLTILRLIPLGFAQDLSFVFTRTLVNKTKTFLKAKVGLDLPFQPMSQLCVGLLRSSQPSLLVELRRGEDGWRAILPDQAFGFRVGFATFSVPERSTCPTSLYRAMWGEANMMLFEPRLSPPSARRSHV